MSLTCTSVELRRLTRKVSPGPDKIPEVLPVNIPQVAYSRISAASVSECQKEKGFVLCSILHQRRKRLGSITGSGKVTVEGARKYGVPLKTTILREVLSEGDTVKWLIELGVIEVKKNYSAGYRSRSYWFTDEVLAGRYTQVDITNKKRIEKLMLWRSSKLYQQFKEEKHPADVPNSTLLRIFEDLAAIRPDKEGIRRLVKSIRRMKEHSHLSKQILNYFRTSYGMIFKVSYSGRITSHLTCLPHRIEETRHYLQLNGEYMVEWDIPSSHPAIILSHFKKEERQSEDFKTITSLMNLGLFYDAYTSTWELDGDETSSSKILFQKFINSPKQDWRSNPMYSLMSKELPVFLNVLKRLKRKYPGKGLSNYIQGLEAKLILRVVTRLHQDEIPCFTVYDSIGIPVSQAIQAKDIFNDELEKFLGFRLSVKTDSPNFSHLLLQYPRPISARNPHTNLTLTLAAK